MIIPLYYSPRIAKLRYIINAGTILLDSLFVKANHVCMLTD